ncbi:MAG: TonB family protein [Acidobacteriota bacterium]|nr:TonB family protein [Acidobacteriota bacterium]
MDWLNVDTYDQREPLGKPLMGSLATHVVVGGLFVAANLIHLNNSWGSQTQSSGSVGVTMVSTIPIQRHEGPKNPLANDTANITPQETAEVKTKPVEQAPDPKAIEIPDKREKPKKVKPKPQPPVAMFRPQAYQPNQVYSRSPQSVSNPMYGIQGAGGIDVGPASVLGDRFGAYTNLMRMQIAQHWNRADVRALPSQKCTVSFAIARNGTVSNVKITHPSGSLLLDNSAQRAVIDSNPLPSLPREFTGSEATVEIVFQIPQ